MKGDNGWARVAIKRLSRISYGLGQPPPLSPEGVPIIRATNINRGNISSENLIFASREDLPLARAPLLSYGEILVVRSGAYTGDSAMITEEWVGSAPGYDLRITPLSVEPRFLAYAIRSSVVEEQIRLAKSRAAQPHLNAEELGEVLVDLPPLCEQRRIADFLDDKTRRLAELQSRYEQALALFQERWWAVVRQFVIGKPVRAEVAVDVGPHIPWLGEVRSGWPVTTLGRISRTYMGTTFPHAFQGKGAGDIPFIKVADFAKGDVWARLGVSDNWVTKSDARILGAQIVPAGSVLYARVGAAMLLNQRRLTTRDAIVDDNVRAVKICSGDPRYWLYLLELLDLARLSNPGPVPSVGESQVSAVHVPLPPESEQKAIADSLDDLRSERFLLAKSISRQIALLNEYRQSLITAAVTGEMEVRAASEIRI
ncbi:restriction endonuclease subunit S [Micromonospora sp. CPCC 206060]|uniref:restriction endonuclease subunit S n=1 Tax=Micromonospora sp. CPCC 206060 TaxID=3122406 RepID=UPI002FF3E199